MEKRGFKMIAGGGFIGQYSFSDKIATNRPDEADEGIQKEFGEAIYQKSIVNNDHSFNHKIKIDWPDEGAFSTVKCAIISALPGLGFALPKSWNELVISDACIKCGKCVKNCPVEALVLNGSIQQNRDKCIGCQACNRGCPTAAIKPVSHKLIKSINNVMQYRNKRKEPSLFI
jgi:ferredoxin